MAGEWEETTLVGVSADVAYGYTESASDEQIGPRFLRITDIQNGVVDWHTVPYCPISESDHRKYRLHPGDIVVARTGNSTGENYLYRGTEDAVYASYLIRFRVNQRAADPAFVWYNMRTQRWQDFINSSKTGSAQAGANAKVLGLFQLLLPPLAEQKAIAAVLGALDDKIELNRRMNATLEAMARALFQSWFVDFDPVRAKLDGRLPAGLDPATAALFPDHLEDSPLGHIPKGWKVGKIQDCCVQIQNGGTPRRNEPRFWDGGNIPWLASGEVRQSIITTTESFITDEGLAESSAKWVPAFSTVVALYGATAGQVSFTSSRLTTNQAVCALIPKKDFAFFNYITMREATAELENKAVGSAQQNISKGIVEETKVVLPPPALVERFAAVVSPLFDRWISNLHQSSTLSTLRDTLLPKLLSGELSLRSDHV
jgi:type I restriction enzyme, S subunit